MSAVETNIKALLTVAAFYSPKRTVERTTLSRTTLWRMVRRGDFPAPVRLSQGRVGFPADSVEAWIRARVK